MKWILISLLFVSCSWDYNDTSQIMTHVTITGNRHAISILDGDTLGSPPIETQVSNGEHTLIIWQKTRIDTFEFYATYPWQYNFEVPYRRNFTRKND